MQKNAYIAKDKIEYWNPIANIYNEGTLSFLRKI
jgi:hypothetical protein